ncbi:MAG: Gfo/Idh/MocA family protein [Planctomycetota bacterium]|jgi:predicted dehydrogenase
MAYKTTRRRFLQTAAATGAGYWVAGGVQAQQSNSPNERIQFACVAVAGKGDSDSNAAADHGDIVAICDVDEIRLNNAARRKRRGEQRFIKAKRYTDFRKMLEEMEKSIDAVTVSTPDHTHAPASLMAMRMGKHCFCQKPMTHAIYEARLMGQVAREKKVATQMGNQFTALSAARKAAAQVKAGVVGTPKELHVWTNRPVWAQGGPRPKPAPVPAHLKWDLWLGPAPERPYGPGYHDFAWRGWWDFGTGALGDMACHTVNMPNMALDLRNPTSVQADTTGHNKDSYPSKSTITFEFPANDWRPALKMVWYDGGRLPSRDLLGGKKPTISGSLIVGDKASMYAKGDYAERGIEFIGDVSVPEVEFVESPGHVEEWIRAIRGGEPAMSNFPDFAGPLTETILLGNLAVWAANEEGLGPKVGWDAKSMKSTGGKELETIVKPVYRKGYTLDV